MFSQIIDSIKTKDDLITLQAELNSLKDGLYSKNEVVLYKDVRKKTADIINIELEKSEDAANEIDLLIKKLDAVEVVSITISYEPTQHDVDVFYDSLNKILNNFVIDLKINPYILGGCLVHYKGEYRDYSLIKTIEREFSKIRMQSEENNSNSKTVKNQGS